MTKHETRLLAWLFFSTMTLMLISFAWLLLAMQVGRLTREIIELRDQRQPDAHRSIVRERRPETI